MTPPDDAPRPAFGPAVGALAVLFTAVCLVLIAFHWPAPFDDAGAWAIRLGVAGACGLAAAWGVWRAAAYPRPRPPASPRGTPPTS